MDDRSALLWLHSIEGLSQRAVGKLLSEFGDASAVWEQPEEAGAILSGKQFASLLEAHREDFAEQALRRLERAGVTALTWADEAYPTRLRQIHDSPPVVYLMGDEDLSFVRSVAIVGSRKATADGLLTARTMGRELAEKGVCVVSGMAAGIDGAAQEGCLDGRGRTAAVLGCAIDLCYPPEHRALRDRILESGGTVLSEHPPGRRTYPHHFSERNRLVTALADALVVVEAGEKSGALSSTAYAREQDRPCFAVPGSIYSHACRGSNALLTGGARCACSARDILKGMDWEESHPDAGEETAPVAILDPDSRRVVDFLQDDEKSFDEIVNHLQIEVTRLNSLLTILEMQGIIRQSAGKLYRAVI